MVKSISVISSHSMIFSCLWQMVTTVVPAVFLEECTNCMLKIPIGCTAFAMAYCPDRSEYHWEIFQSLWKFAFAPDKRKWYDIIKTNDIKIFGFVMHRSMWIMDILPFMSFWILQIMANYMCHHDESALNKTDGFCTFSYNTME